MVQKTKCLLVEILQLEVNRREKKKSANILWVTYQNCITVFLGHGVISTLIFSMGKVYKAGCVQALSRCCERSRRTSRDHCRICKVDQIVYCVGVLSGLLRLLCCIVLRLDVADDEWFWSQARDVQSTLDVIQQSYVLYHLVLGHGNVLGLLDEGGRIGQGACIHNLLKLTIRNGQSLKMLLYCIDYWVKCRRLKGPFLLFIHGGRHFQD